MDILKNIGATLFGATAMVAVMQAPAAAATHVGTFGTKDNPVIVKEYSASEVHSGIAARQGIGRGRTFEYTIDSNHVEVAFANTHRTRGWHLCFGMVALDDQNKIVAEGVLKQGLREKGFSARDRKVQSKTVSFPSDMKKLRLQFWRCSEKDFGPELLKQVKQLGKLVASVKGVAKLFPVKLF